MTYLKNMNNITVIIPMKNEIKHIERSVRSALQLTDKVRGIN